jgi:predicted nucleic acid-binding Zn ribbon protein
VSNSSYASQQAASQARARALAEWRRVDLREAEGAAGSRVRPMPDLVQHLLSGLRLDQRVLESELMKLWPKIVDPNIALHSRPVGIKKGTLFVNVDSNVWLSEIVRYRRKEVLERVQTAMGKNTVERISFRVG